MYSVSRSSSLYGVIHNTNMLASLSYSYIALVDLVRQNISIIFSITYFYSYIAFVDLVPYIETKYKYVALLSFSYIYSVSRSSSLYGVRQNMNIISSLSLLGF